MVLGAIMHRCRVFQALHIGNIDSDEHLDFIGEVFRRHEVFQPREKAELLLDRILRCQKTYYLLPERTQSVLKSKPRSQAIAIGVHMPADREGIMRFYETCDLLERGIRLRREHSLAFRGIFSTSARIAGSISTESFSDTLRVIHALIQVKAQFRCNTPGKLLRHERTDAPCCCVEGLSYFRVARRFGR